MANKITIEGQDLLQTLQDAWGGVNDGNSPITPYSDRGADNVVPAGAEWGVNRGEVESFIKRKLGESLGKYGYLHIPLTKDNEGFYHLHCYLSEAAYLADPTDYVQDIQIPISTDKGVSYSARLVASTNALTDIVVADKAYSVGLRFTSILNDNGDIQNAGENGTLTFQRSLDGGNSWSDVGTALIQSRDADDVGFDPYDVGQYLVLDRKALIRVHATYTIDGVGTFTSAWVSVTSATYTSLSLECKLNWQNPIQSSVIDSTGFPISYLVHCAADMVLHIWIAGEGGSFDFEREQTIGNVFTTSISISANENGTTIVRDFRDIGGTNRLNTHGVHAVAAWLTCNDGLGNTLKSDILVNRFMVINTASENVGKPYIMLQDVISQVENYAKATICSYAVFNPQIIDGEVVPSEEPLHFSIYITNRAPNFPSGNVTYYLNQDVDAKNGEQYSLEASIGIESETIGMLDAYLRVWRVEDETDVNFLNESIGEEFLYIAVDNADAFVPTLGATFAINPALRSNNEATPQRILNSQAGNTEIASSWSNTFSFGADDGWITAADGFKVLRVLAGQSVNFLFNPFAQFLSAPASSMTLEFDIKAFNVTNEDDPIISLFEEINAGVSIERRGLFIRPMEGNFYIKDSNADDETNFRWREGERTHIAINIENAIQPSVRGDGLYSPTVNPNPPTSVAIARVFINGNIEREMLFTADANQFCTGEMSNGGFTIGQSGADIDIYGIRCYANRSLSAENIKNNYIATLPTGEQKRQVRYDNDIIRGSRVDVEEVKRRGKRVLILHGDEPYHRRPTVGNTWWEIFQYDKDGNYDPELSGTICKANGMNTKRQGSTANTYYYSNIQTKVGEINKDGDTGYIDVPLNKIHASLTVSEPYEVTIKDGNNNVVGTKWVVGIYGGNLGAYDPWENEAKEYDYNDGVVTVPDGWIDGNGMYRGMGYMVARNTPLAQKLVLKVNYASSMQSHLCGGCRLYNDLHTAVVGRNELQQRVSTARVTKYTEPVFFFTQANGSDDVVFRGGGNFGAGKMDKPTWGYVKKKHPMFTMIEGSDNNFPLTDMRVPFITDPDCAEYARYDAGEEGWMYLSGNEELQCFDFDAGKTDGNDAPVTATVNEIQRMLNFCYLHSPMIKYYDGSFEDFAVSSYASDVVSKYWCRDGNDQYLLKRYNFSTRQWVDAGLWNGSSYDEIDLRSYEMTAGRWNSLTPSERLDPEKANAAFKAGIVAHAKKYIGLYFNVDSLMFHYAFQNHFMAGTDNCSKNTYFVLMPTAKDVTIDGVTHSVYLWELHQDDVDTILLTDNNGRSTKPYYIDRMHPYAEYDQHTSCYEGENNVLFNLVEAMWEESRELQSMLKRILSAMQGLVTEADIAKGYTKSVMGCMNKYLFDIQRYFPIMAYNEQARIRYEFPALLGFKSEGAGARGIFPITQSMGNQLEAEMQFVIRRVIYMASYAGWGQLHDGGKNDDIGVADVVAGFSFQMFHLPNQQQSDNNYTFELTAHQFIYPTGMLGQTAIDPHVRLKAGNSYRLNLGNSTSNDSGLSVLGANLYRSFGNVGDLSTTPANSVQVNGNRLVEFLSKPTTQYEENGRSVGAWRPNSISFNSPLIRRIELDGSGIGGSLDVRGLPRLEYLSIVGNYFTALELARSKTLTTLMVSANLSTLIIDGQPNLDTLYFEGVGNIKTLVLVDVPQHISINETAVNINSLLVALLAVEPFVLENLTLRGINTSMSWAAFDRFMQISKIVVTGRINIVGTITFEQALAVSRFNDQHEELVVTFSEIPVDAINIATRDSHWNWGYCDKGFGDEDYADYNFALVTTGNGNNVKSIVWEIDKLVDGNESTVNAVINENGVMRVVRSGVDNGLPVIVRCVVTLLDDTQLSAEQIISFNTHTAAVGDYVYADGTFSDVFNAEKTVVGVCYYTDGVDRRMVCCKNITLKDNANTRYTRWGLTSNSSNGITGLTYDDNNSYNVYDIAGITNIGVASTGNPRSVWDADNFSGVMRGDDIPKGKFNTLKIIVHRNKILNSERLSELFANSNFSVWDSTPIPRQHGGHTEIEDLYQKVTRFVQVATAEGLATASRYYLFYYECASVAYAYKPAVNEWEEDVLKFKEHNWWLPDNWDWLEIGKGFLNNPSTSAGNAIKTPNIFTNAINAGVFTIFTTSTGYGADSTNMGSGGVYASAVETGANNTTPIRVNHTGDSPLLAYSGYGGNGKNLAMHIRAVANF